MDMGFAPTWLRQVSPPASQNHFNHWYWSIFADCFHSVVDYFNYSFIILSIDGVV